MQGHQLTCSCFGVIVPAWANLGEPDHRWRAIAGLSKVLVVEPAELLQDLPQAQGVLIYSVDSGIDGGHSPIVVHPRAGGGLDDAPHRIGNVAVIEDEKGTHFRVTVLGRTGPAWDVEISFTPAPQN